MILNNDHPEIVMIGAGIMSATLAVFLKELLPNAHITIFERLDKVGAESSDAWNNAGTGHAAYCELNYTPQDEETGDINISKALSIAEQFEISKQFWAYLVEKKCIGEATNFINHIDHMSFVNGEANKHFLKKRYDLLTQNTLFVGMEYTEDAAVMKEWFPLMMEERADVSQLAATKMHMGTDVNFGALTKAMIGYLQSSGCGLKLGYEVDKIKKKKSGKWQLEVKDLTNDDDLVITADFVFIGAGGGSLTLLEKTDIPEANGYGGFPVSGQWLKCINPTIINQHHAKVYGKAAVGAPPMSVPHLDTRVINGQKALLFGPYAGFSTKFLKNGSYLDLFLSIESHNVWPMLTAGYNNIPLTKYLINQVMQSDEERLNALQDFYPCAAKEDWQLVEAGQRVQVIKQEGKHGTLKFGTEVVTDAEGTVATLLGASPGASTSVSIMLDIIEQCFPDLMKDQSVVTKLKSMIPSFGTSLKKDSDLLHQCRAHSSSVLGLTV
jgi:malate dehydrogenase (quinone)